MLALRGCISGAVSVFYGEQQTTLDFLGDAAAGKSRLFDDLSGCIYNKCRVLVFDILIVGVIDERRHSSHPYLHLTPYIILCNENVE